MKQLLFIALALLALPVLALPAKACNPALAGASFRAQQSLARLQAQAMFGFNADALAAPINPFAAGFTPFTNGGLVDPFLLSGFGGRDFGRGFGRGFAGRGVRGVGGRRR